MPFYKVAIMKQKMWTVFCQVSRNKLAKADIYVECNPAAMG
jgi:hypothetical protein